MDCRKFGPHAVFIVASYGAAVLALAALVLWVWLDYRAQQARSGARSAGRHAPLGARSGRTP
jgi:heme exporter protein CcmD